MSISCCSDTEDWQKKTWKLSVCLFHPSVKWFKGFILFDLWENFESICVGVTKSFNVSYDDDEQELEAGDEYSWLPVSE